MNDKYGKPAKLGVTIPWQLSQEQSKKTNNGKHTASRAQRQTREDQRELINSFGNCAVGSAEVHQMVVDESFIKYCSMTTRVEGKEQYMETNHDNMLPITTEHLNVIAKEKNLLERDRDRMYLDALEKEVPEKGATYCG